MSKATQDKTRQGVDTTKSVGLHWGKVPLESRFRLSNPRNSHFLASTPSLPDGVRNGRKGTQMGGRGCLEGWCGDPIACRALQLATKHCGPGPRMLCGAVFGVSGPPLCGVGGQPGAENRDSGGPPLGKANPIVSGRGQGLSRRLEKFACVTCLLVCCFWPACLLLVLFRFFANLDPSPTLVNMPYLSSRKI